MGIKVELNDEQISERAVQRYNELHESGQIPEQMSYKRAMDELVGQERMKERKVDPGETKEWTFENVRLKNPDDPNAIFFVRYKYRATSTPPDDKVLGIWQVGDLRQLLGGAKMKTPIFNYEQSEVVRTSHEFIVPASALADDGYLEIKFYNHPAYNQTTIILEELEILYQTGTFTENYIRSTLMILVRLIFLTILGISLTTWLSFPVAILVCVVVFFAGLTNGFILDAISSLEATAGIIYSLTVKPMLWLLPQFDGDYNPNGYIVAGRTLRWAFLGMTTVMTLLVKGFLLLLAGMLIFNRREVAKTTT
jgi:hypothetical protein